MVGRYLLTGVQIGLLKTLHKHDTDEFEKTLQDIINKQFVGNSNASIEDDVHYLDTMIFKD